MMERDPLDSDYWLKAEHFLVLFHFLFKSERLKNNFIFSEFDVFCRPKKKNYDAYSDDLRTGTT